MKYQRECVTFVCIFFTFHSFFQIFELHLTTFLTHTLLFLYFLETRLSNLKKKKNKNKTKNTQKNNNPGICCNKVYRQCMPIFIEITLRIFKISRFESNFPENENHKFTIFQTNQYGEREKNKRCYRLNYITSHFKSTH